ncbi:hypothetical protein PS834_04256 [Pseudomonas fluorescens]|nr:hypothetical protein PS834_04256 [Pseudomonas fluorescens]
MSNNNSFAAPFFRNFIDGRIVLSELTGESVTCTVGGQAALEQGDIIQLQLEGWRSDNHTVNISGYPQSIQVPVGILRRYPDRKVDVMYRVSRNGQHLGTSETLFIDIVS